MSDPTAQEPTMEEILASIRRIISEDDAPAAEPPVAHAAPEPAPTPHLAAVAPSPALAYEAEEEDDDVLELTEPAPKPAETHGDLDVFDAEPPPKPEPVMAAPPAPPAPAPEPMKPAPVMHEPPYAPSFSSGGFDDERLISGRTEDKAASHFGKLSQSIAMPPAGRNLEDVVSELLKPLLKDWLDTHLPAIVEEKVQAEVERISRRRV
jgi:cell pole-organizing protein PopZ